MTVQKYILHSSLLLAEIVVLFGLLLMTFFCLSEKDTLLVHFNDLRAYVLAVAGLSSLFMAFLMKLGTLRLDDDKHKSLLLRTVIAALSLVGFVATAQGLRLALFEYPEKFRGSRLKTAQERMADFGAVKIMFDVSDGLCSDVVRVVRCGDCYKDTMNLYPSESQYYFADLWAGKINLPRGLIYLSKSNSDKVDGYVNYFSNDAVSLVSTNEVWTYVVDIDRFSGAIANWFVGQTLPTNRNEYVCFERGHISRDVKSGDKRFLRLKSNPWTHYELLDRGVIVVGPGQSFEVSFRVSLFAGTGVNESNYHYVRPGETLACPLPVPTREGYAFEGWYDGERRITEESKVEKRVPHALKARWRKL